MHLIKHSLFLMMAADKNGGGSAKWDKAVGRATGQGDAPASNAPSTALPTSMISKFTEEDVAADMADPNMEFAPQVYKLEEGDQIVGILEGNGPDAELEQIDRATKEVKINVVKTWIIAHPSGGQRVSILSSVQLDRKLPPFVGSLVKIRRGKQIETNNGQRVNDYQVVGPKKEDGQRRSWAMKPVLDVPSSAGALPAGGHAGAVDEAPAATPANVAS